MNYELTNYELTQKKGRPGKEIKEIENLIAAYSVAQNSRLTEANLLRCHKDISDQKQARQIPD